MDKIDCEVELTPKWWEDQKVQDGKFIVIPDGEYGVVEGQIDYGGAAGEGTNYRTGVIVKGPSSVGMWCHYKIHGPYEFHPFRERFSNGKKSPLENKSALLIREDDLVLITNQKIF